MPKYRENLPLLNNNIFACYVGMNTELLYRDGIDLPGFASYPLLMNSKHKKLIRNYYCNLVDLARDQNVGVILDSVTWVASRDRGAALGFTPSELKSFNIQAIELMAQVRESHGDLPTLLCGQVGPRGDSYAPKDLMITGHAEEYHSEQIETYSITEADLVGGFTFCYPEEASGVVRAAQRFNMPVVISFTVETDGRLPIGMSIQEAIEQVDAETNQGALYFLINCAHPDHLSNSFGEGQWLKRLKGVVVNASRCSHAELEVAEKLDDGDPDELGVLVGKLRKQNSHFNIFGGCCGTNFRHMKRILEEVKLAA